MAFTLNSGEFDLGAGFIGRGTILAGETYVAGTSTTGVQGILNTAGLEALTFEVLNTYPFTIKENYARGVKFRASNDALTSAFTVVTNEGSTNTGVYDLFIASPGAATCDPGARFYLAFQANGSDSGNQIANNSIINSSSSVSPVIVRGSNGFEDNFLASSTWRFLARDHATALTHYPSTTEKGSVFAGSFVNSTTQWGLWIAGEVGDRSGYFNQTQGYFAIVMLRNGSTWYFSAFTPAAANSTSRNDNVIRSFNIVPAPGQTGADRFSELFIARDLGNGLSETIGKVPGFIYVDMNQAANSALYVGSLLEITPGVGTSYELLNNGAIVVAQWGLDISATTSNVGSTFTIDTASTPSLASLSSLNRTRTTLEENQRIQITATPPTGLSTATNYWVKNWNPTAFTFQLAATEGGAAIVPSININSTITRYAGLIAMPCYQA